MRVAIRSIWEASSAERRSFLINTDSHARLRSGVAVAPGIVVARVEEPVRQDGDDLAGYFAGGL